MTYDPAQASVTDRRASAKLAHHVSKWLSQTLTMGRHRGRMVGVCNGTQLCFGGECQTRLVLDFVPAWSFGIVFQYLKIAPMQGLSFRRGILEAMRADTLSIVSFQIGLFAWMVLTYYVFFPNHTSNQRKQCSGS